MTRDALRTRADLCTRDDLRTPVDVFRDQQMACHTTVCSLPQYIQQVHILSPHTLLAQIRTSWVSLPLSLTPRLE